MAVIASQWGAVGAKCTPRADDQEKLPTHEPAFAGSRLISN